MKKLIAALFMITALASCTKEEILGSGTTRTETRPLTGFTKIDVQGTTDVTVVYGTAFEVRVQAYENLLPYLETNVVNGTLKIGYKPGTGISNDNSHVFITMPQLTKVTANGLSKISLSNGTADSFEAVLTGIPVLKAFGFTVKQAKITMEGQGTVEVMVTEKLNAKITGAATVYYKGNPSSVLSDITGSGKVIKQ